MDNRPIGVFDSGIGGLTAVRALRELLPNESIVYFGDVARVPYGTRSRETIIKYTAQDIRFLFSHDVKMVIAACGTASSNFPSEQAKALTVPFTGVVLPAAQAACAATKTGKIGVIGTSATIRSGAYGKAVRSVRADAVVMGNACPLFVPLVENGYTARDSAMTILAAKQYLAPFLGKVDTLILGCTHYSVITEIIADIVGDSVTLIDAGATAARHAQTLLTAGNLLADGEQQGEDSYFVSDSPEDFRENARLYLGSDACGSVTQINIEDY